MKRRHKPNQVEHRPDGTSVITLTMGQVAIIDTVDYPLIEDYRWFANENHRTFYAVSSGKQVKGVRERATRMHVLIHQALTGETGQEVDHIDHHGLNNRRQNLRGATHAENVCNRRTRKDSTTGIKGVHREKDGRFRVQCQIGGKRFHVGRFKTTDEAAAAYTKAAKELHGDYAFSDGSTNS